MSAGILALADDLQVARLTAHPFWATEDGIPGYDHLAPDVSASGRAKYAAVLDDLEARAESLSSHDNTAEQAVTLDVIRHHLATERAWLSCGGVDHTVGYAMTEGPNQVLTVAERTDPECWPERALGCVAYLRDHAAWLAEGTAAGRLPVAGLVAVAIEQLDDYLADEPEPVLVGALQEWRTAVLALPTRSDDECGLVHIPHGIEDYTELTRIHTSLDLTADTIHELGLQQVEQISARMVELGAELGLATLPEVLTAYLMSGQDGDAETVITEATEILHRAELIAPSVIAPPDPGPCEIRPMPEHLARSGAAPHYTPPNATTPGVFWFNGLAPENAAGWGLEALTFHEAVPGHHLQLARTQLLTGLPDLQRTGFFSAHGEGWGLYAEHLAEELGLYSGVGPRIGALGLRLFRAARLVVDTGIHAKGWSRARAVEWFTSVVPLPPAFADAEILRYIAVPGQALSYSVGYLELLALRTRAQDALGERFSLSEFHGRVLDSGSIPLTTLRRIIDEWISA